MRQMKDSLLYCKTFQPFIKNARNRIVNRLKKHHVWAIFKPPKTIQTSLGTKDPRAQHSISGVYLISCCGEFLHCYESFNTRFSEHKRRYHSQKSALAEHILKHDNHNVRLEGSGQVWNGYPRLFRKAIAILKKHSRNFNRNEEDCNLSKMWTKMVHQIKMSPIRTSDT